MLIWATIHNKFSHVQHFVVECFIVAYRPPHQFSQFGTICKKHVLVFQMCNLDDLEKILTPFKNIIFESETKQADDINFHCFTISFNGLLEYYNVNIMVNIFHIGWILHFMYGNLVVCSNIGCVAIGGYIPWWHKHAWIKCWPSKWSNTWIKWWSSKWISYRWTSSRWISKLSSILWMMNKTSSWYMCWQFVTDLMHLSMNWCNGCDIWKLYML